MSDLFEHIKDHPVASIVSAVVLVVLAAGVIANLGDFDIAGYITDRIFSHLVEKEPVIGMIDDRLSSLPEVRFQQIVCTGPVEYDGSGVSC